jgi:hypothetical protein
MTALLARLTMPFSKSPGFAASMTERGEPKLLVTSSANYAPA